ncbi:MBL fold metallo-hydrolase [Coraliomargarita sp. SDUM461003]|uniref:MBL fold metallo-hydrolase n=1 Tax=Thalassobacterium maritimum TaxID=3041265 RepID=A0ABU1AP84_9BACT|nr:MBL fold metallo-hydrolase [Coraliomargarita sp. SDUM461003]MDQ8205979.1 MBL fold metallo-hydrolase [Coraliomargarita sp. SDUM461003]
MDTQARKKALPMTALAYNCAAMSIEFQILGSSSGGNCALLHTGHTKVLVDVGFSAKRIGCMLEAVGESLDAIDAVFLTHEHSDHAQGIRGLAKRADLPVFANRDTADAVQAKATKPVNWQIFQTGTDFSFRDLKVRSFALPHDAYDPVGFKFNWGQEGDLFSPPRSLAWVTDLGYVPEHVKAHIRDVQTLVVEANYDEELLEQDERRPWSTKQRIRGRHGHLSNHASFELVEELSQQSTLQQVYLAHLSKDCNNARLVHEKFAPLLKKLSIKVVDPQSGIAPASKVI